MDVRKIRRVTPVGGRAWRPTDPPDLSARQSCAGLQPAVDGAGPPGGRKRRTVGLWPPAGHRSPALTGRCECREARSQLRGLPHSDALESETCAVYTTRAVHNAPGGSYTAGEGESEV